MTSEFKKIKNNEDTHYVLETATAGATSAGVVATAPGKKREDSILAQEANKKKEATKPRNFVAKNAKMGGAGQHKDKKKAAKQGAVKHKKPLAESYAEDLAKQVFNGNPNIKDENAILDAAWPIAVKDLGNKRAMSVFNYDEDFPSDLVSVYGWLQKGMAEGFNGEYDDEAGMAHTNLLTSARAVMGLLKTIEDKDNLPEWVQEKIAKAEMMLVGVWDYLQSQKEQGIDPQVEGFGKMRGSSSAYDRDYASSVSGMGRGPDHRGLGQELAHETNNYAVAIDGKTWKVFADQRQAENIARSLKAKGKNATVHPTGENPSESVAEVAPPGWEKTVKAMKKHDNIDNPFALAWSMKNKGYKSHKKESADPYFESLRAKVEELAKK
jgi:hypothetical protein